MLSTTSGSCMTTGEGVPENDAEAVRWDGDTATMLPPSGRTCASTIPGPGDHARHCPPSGAAIAPQPPGSASRSARSRPTTHAKAGSTSPGAWSARCPPGLVTCARVLHAASDSSLTERKGGGQGVRIERREAVAGKDHRPALGVFQREPLERGFQFHGHPPLMHAIGVSRVPEAVRSAGEDPNSAPIPETRMVPSDSCGRRFRGSLGIVPARHGRRCPPRSRPPARHGSTPCARSPRRNRRPGNRIAPGSAASSSKRIASHARSVCRRKLWAAPESGGSLAVRRP